MTHRPPPAREVQRRSFAENERLQHETRRMCAQLREALAAIDESEADARDDEAEPATEPEAEAVEERSWYGFPDEPAPRAADAA